jgi:hypothetical protein
MEIDNLLELYLKSKKEKKEAISCQKYEIAANARDSERKHSVDLYELLSGDKVKAFDYNKFDKMIDEYCMSNYEVSIYDTHSLTQIIRQKRLNDLGI